MANQPPRISTAILGGATVHIPSFSNVFNYSGGGGYNIPTYMNLTQVYVSPSTLLQNSPLAETDRGPASNWRDAIWGKSTKSDDE